MVANPRAPVRAGELRTLNRPEPLAVVAGEAGEPKAVRAGGRVRVVAKIRDRWRIDDEWWRKPIRRMYFLVEYADGVQETLYQDLVDQSWYRQRERPVPGINDG